MRKKNKLSQAQARCHKFAVHQYWSISYIEIDKLGVKHPYSVIIKSKSYAGAKRILLAKVKEDSPSSKLKFSAYCFWIHKNFRTERKGFRVLTLKDWEDIRNASFPNPHNILFKAPWEGFKEKKLSPSACAALKKVGFQAGDKNWCVKHRKGVSLPQEERAKKVYRGKWVEWDPEERSMEKDRLIRALSKHKNNRSKAAKELGVSRNKIYFLFKRFPEVDWENDYAAPSPIPPLPRTLEEASRRARKGIETRRRKGEVFFKNAFSEEANQKRRSTRRANDALRRKDKIRSFAPKIIEALRLHKNCRTKAAAHLGISSSSLYRYMNALNEKINWHEDYPTYN